MLRMFHVKHFFQNTQKIFYFQKVKIVNESTSWYTNFVHVSKDNLQVETLINQYIDLLTRWNKSVNLVQKNTIKSALNRHISDSMQIIDMLHQNDNIIDIGSGAGLPGVILSIYGMKNVVLCEKNFKKSVFLRNVKNKLNLNFEIFNDDILNFNKIGYISVSRAFGSLLKLLDIMLKISSPKGVFHKGESCMFEIDEASNYFDFEYKLTKSITNKNSFIIEVWNVRRKAWEK